MFRLGDFPFTWFKAVTAFTEQAFYMVLKIVISQIAEFIENESCRWKECVTELAITGLQKNVLTELARTGLQKNVLTELARTGSKRMC
jgi:hypothetical protein